MAKVRVILEDNLAYSNDELLRFLTSNLAGARSALDEALGIEAPSEEEISHADFLKSQTFGFMWTAGRFLRLSKELNFWKVGFVVSNILWALNLVGCYGA